MDRAIRYRRVIWLAVPLLLLSLFASGLLTPQAYAADTDTTSTMQEFAAVKATGEQPAADVSAIENAPKQVGGYKSKYGLLMKDGKLYPCNKKGKKLGKYWKVGSTITYVFVAANVTKYTGTWKTPYKSAVKLSYPVSYKIKTIHFLTKGGKNNVKKIGSNAIDSTVKKLVNFDKTKTTKIGAGAFSNCAVTKIALPKTLTSIGNRAFYSTSKLKTVSGLKKTKVEKIPQEAFRYSAITSISFPKSLKSIGIAAFANCGNLKSIGGFPSTAVTTLGNYAFNTCPKLTSVSLPATCNTLGSAVFNSCSALKSVKIPSTTVVSATYDVLGHTYYDGGGTAGAYIYVPASLLNAYKADANWSHYAASFAAIA